MTLINRTTSIIGNLIVGDVKKFISDNAKAATSEKSATPEEGADAMAHAIAYGIAKALSSSPVQAAFIAGICPPAGGPVGSLIFTPLSAAAKEL